MAKKFMFICFGILALAGAYAVGANNSVAQVGAISDVAMASIPCIPPTSSTVVTVSGDIYVKAAHILESGAWSNPAAQWTYMGNCFAGGAVNSQGTTIGDVKSLFR